jgi:hypothetical protein
MLPVTASFLTPLRLWQMELSAARVCRVMTVDVDAADAAANDPLAVDGFPPPGIAKPSSPRLLVTSCERESTTVLGLKAAPAP